MVLPCKGLSSLKISPVASLVIISGTRNIEIDENCPFTCCAFSYYTRKPDQVLFWNAHNLEKKLDAKDYYNGYRVHAALDGKPPLNLSGNDVLGKHQRVPVEITLPRSSLDADGSVN